MRSRSYTVLVLSVGLGIGVNSYADSRVQTKYTTNGQTNETTIYSKGGRQRFDSGNGIGIINQSDLMRTIQFFDQTKAYMVISAETLARAAAGGTQAQAAPSPTGGMVTVTTNVTPTEERKEMFGYTARRVKSVMTREAGAGTCMPGNETIETDGWYIDYQPEDAPNIIKGFDLQAGTAAPCHDEISYKQTGDGKLGYPLATSVIRIKDGKTTSIGMEVTAFSTAALDAALFEIPAGYTEMSSFKELGAVLAGGHPAGSAEALTPPPPKTPGSIRIGVAELGNHSDKSLGPVSPRERLITQLAAAGIDAIPLAGSSPSEVEEASRQKECDYVLYADVTEVKKDTGGFGKLGGVLNKAQSVTGGAPKEKIEAKIEYKLLPAGNSKALVSSSASGSNGGGLTVNSAMRLATAVTPLGMLSRMGVFDPNMMDLLSRTGAFSQAGQSGATPNASRSGLGQFLSIMQITQSLAGPSEPTEEGKAASNALDDIAKKVIEAVKKKK